MIKAAIVTREIPHYEVPLFRLAAAFADLDVNVFHCDANANTRYDEQYQSVIDWGGDIKGGYPSSYHPAAADLKAALWRWQPDVILLYGYSWKGALSILARARLRGIPVVHRGTLSPYPDPRRGAVSKLWRKARPLLFRQFQGHHYGGSYSEQVLDEARIPESRRYFVPYSVDTPYFSAQADDPVSERRAIELRKTIGWPADAPVMLYICQHNWFKGPDIMLEIASQAQDRYPELKLLMVGSGRMTQELKVHAKDNLLPGSFHFPGFVSSMETVPFYLASTIVVFPSRYDTWSRAVNEAMLSRRPCLVSRMVPAAGGLVDDGENGYVVNGLDPEPYVERIAKIINLPPEERRHMGEAARSRALEFAYEAHTDALRRSMTEVAR